MYDRMFTNIKKQAERVIPTNEGDYLGDGSVLVPYPQTNADLLGGDGQAL